jgi:hypothetical protein
MTSGSGPQPPDRGLHRGRERVRRGVPHPVEQFLRGHHPAARRQQALEHTELLRTEIKPAPGPDGDPAGRVDRELAELKHGR